MPVVGRQLRSAEALAGAAAQVTTTGATTARELASVLADPPASGPQRLVALDQVSTSIGRAERALRVVPLGPREGLVPPLADARQELGREVRTTQDSLRRAAVVTTGLADLLHGPRRYLLLATNNAEMRAGSGMILSAGVLTVAGGELALDGMRPAAELELPPGGVPVEGDQAARWGWAHPGREWRNLAMTPRFDVTGPLAARMWEVSTGQPVDGVVAVDIVALRAVLAATGPVRVAGGLQIGADNVERHLFHDQYEGLAYDKTLEAAQAARRDHLGEIARGAVAAIQGGEADLSKLSSELPRAAAGRHALLWSRRDREQRAWEAAGVSGKVAANSVLPAVLNRAGNKLDQHLEMEAEITASARPDGIRHVTVTLRVTNNTPEGGWPYVVGPHPAIDIVEGTYLGLVALTVPGAATNLSFGPGVTTNVIGPDGPSRVVATEVR
ncbi:MAG: DUF4012 domain-containing protein, partial [Actinobacteria bacterium]|nr:DUF4012 domain-containing protein [Actinomycetota bacterium]